MLARPVRLVVFATIALLAAALLPGIPYAYYLLLRVLVFGLTLYIALLLLERCDSNWRALMIVLALIYNPIFPVRLNKLIWSCVNIVTIALLCLFLKRKCKGSSQPPVQ